MRLLVGLNNSKLHRHESVGYCIYQLHNVDVDVVRKKKKIISLVFFGCVTPTW